MKLEKRKGRGLRFDVVPAAEVARFFSEAQVCAAAAVTFGTLLPNTALDPATQPDFARTCVSLQCS